MKFIRCIVISVWISPAFTKLGLPQSTLQDKEFEIKVGSGPFNRNRIVVSDYMAASEFFENTQGNPILVDVGQLRDIQPSHVNPPWYHNLLDLLSTVRRR